MSGVVMGRFKCPSTSPKWHVCKLYFPVLLHIWNPWMLFALHKNTISTISTSNIVVVLWGIQGTFKCPFNLSKVSKCGNCTVFAQWMCLKLLFTIKMNVYNTNLSQTLWWCYGVSRVHSSVLSTSPKCPNRIIALFLNTRCA